VTGGHLLLDTHVLMWVVNSPERLRSSTRDKIEDYAVDLYVSAAAAWEMATKVSLGRFPVAELLVTTFDDVCARLRIEEVNITTAHGIRAGSLPWSHRDPFDRMHAAQALSEGLTLVTADRVFRDVPGLRTLW
jgi:PIN domain nuclease of toxin-antitoxin system